MNKHILKSWAFVTCAAALLGCERSANGSATVDYKRAFEIHLQSFFRGESVHIEIDGQSLFNKAVTTNAVLGLAEIIKLELPVGEHHIKVVVNDTEEGETSFELVCKLYIGVRYFRDAIPERNIPQGVRIAVTDSPYLYE